MTPTWIHQPIHYQQAQHFSQGAVSRCTAPANFSSQNSSIRNCHHSSQPSQQLPRARAPQLHFVQLHLKTNLSDS